MGAYLIIIFQIRQQYMSEVPLSEHNNVVKAFPSDRTDQPFGISILPRGAVMLPAGDVMTPERGTSTKKFAPTRTVSALLWLEGKGGSVCHGNPVMKAPSVKPVRCAIYTRVSTEHGLDQEFNSLDAQYDAASAYIKIQAHAGWTLIRSRYDDGGYSGGSTDRPDLQKLLDDIRARKIDVIVVYKVDRLTRSLADFAKLVELFDAHSVSFVSVTQQFNTTTSNGSTDAQRAPVLCPVRAG